MHSLQARVRALQRILAPELAVVRLRRLSEEFCIESSVGQASGQPQPHPHAFIQRVAPPSASGSHPSWRSTNTSRGAGTETTSPTVKTSFAPSSPGPGAIPILPSDRDEHNWPSSRQSARGSCISRPNTKNPALSVFSVVKRAPDSRRSRNNGRQCSGPAPGNLCGCVQPGLGP